MIRNPLNNPKPLGLEVMDLGFGSAMHWEVMAMQTGKDSFGAFFFGCGGGVGVGGWGAVFF